MQARMPQTVSRREGKTRGLGPSSLWDRGRPGPQQQAVAGGQTEGHTGGWEGDGQTDRAADRQRASSRIWQRWEKGITTGETAPRRTWPATCRGRRLVICHSEATRKHGRGPACRQPPTRGQVTGSSQQGLVRLLLRGSLTHGLRGRCPACGTWTWVASPPLHGAL